MAIGWLTHCVKGIKPRSVFKPQTQPNKASESFAPYNKNTFTSTSPIPIRAAPAMMPAQIGS